MPEIVITAKSESELIEKLKQYTLEKGDRVSGYMKYVLEAPFWFDINALQNDVNKKIVEIISKLQSEGFIVRDFNAKISNLRMETTWKPPFFVYRADLEISFLVVSDPAIALILATIIVVSISSVFIVWGIGYILEQLNWKLYLDYCKEHPEDPNCKSIPPPPAPPGLPGKEAVEAMAGLGGILMLIIIIMLLREVRR